MTYEIKRKSMWDGICEKVSYDLFTDINFELYCLIKKNKFKITSAFLISNVGQGPQKLNLKKSTYFHIFYLLSLYLSLSL